MFLKKLDYLIVKKGINKSILAKGCGIPYTTLDGFYKKGCDNVKLSTLRKLSNYFDVDLNFWVNDDKLNTYEQKNAHPNEGEQKLIDNYRQLNEEGQGKANEYVSDLVATGRYIKNNKFEVDSKKQA